MAAAPGTEAALQSRSPGLGELEELGCICCAQEARSKAGGTAASRSCRQASNRHLEVVGCRVGEPQEILHDYWCIHVDLPVDRCSGWHHKDAVAQFCLFKDAVPQVCLLP